MRINDQIVKCVAFVSPDSDPSAFAGTAFIVQVPVNETHGMLHLVTARHVAIGAGEDCFVAMNSKSGEVIYAKSKDAPWFYHPTDPYSVDVAILPFATAIIRDYDISPIPVGIFATPERITEFDIGLGDEVFIVGLFTRFFGTSRLIPIVRTGNIAMMPQDQVVLSNFGSADVYLIEGRSIGGLSGSPVFCRNTVNLELPMATGEPRRLAGLEKPHLLGLVHGHWDIPVDLAVAAQQEAVNMGISIVIPAKKILETLYHPELVELRAKFASRTL